jgi:iron uptake system EfeUOB component EfeO/EfeM
MFAAAVLVAAAATALVVSAGNRDPAPAPAPRPHVAIAPAAQAGPHVAGRVAGTTESAQQVAQDAIENSVGPNGRRPDLVPLPVSAFAAPVARYRRYAVGQADAMERSARALEAALRRGDRAGARREWTAAFDRYMLIGAAYGALGDLDDAIDGLPGGKPGGVHDPKFSGLHRIELGLWTGARPATLVPWAHRLAADVRHLPHALGAGEILPLDYATRAHEILEDAQRDQLSGEASPWSGAGVRAVADDLAATRVVIRTLQPVLAGRGDVLQQVDSRLLGLSRRLAAVRRAHGGDYPPLAGLSTAEREGLGGSLGGALEALSGVPGALETQLPPVIPTIPKRK